MSPSYTCIRVITLKSSRADIVPWIVDEGRLWRCRAGDGVVVGGRPSRRTWHTRGDVSGTYQESGRPHTRAHAIRLVTKWPTTYWMQFAVDPVRAVFLQCTVTIRNDVLGCLQRDVKPCKLTLDLQQNKNATPKLVCQCHKIIALRKVPIFGCGFIL